MNIEQNRVPKKEFDPKNVQFFSKEEMDAMKSAVEAAGVEYPKREPKKPPSPEERAKQETMGVINELAKDVQVSVQGAQAAVNYAQRRDIEHTVFPGSEPPKFDIQNVINKENALSRLNIIKNGLNNALNEIQNGLEISEETKSALHELQSLEADNLQQMHSKKQEGKQVESGYQNAQQRLQRITDLMERLGM